ncbi:MAG: DUF1289 domain-containing protein [OM182 bacterium MED-G24]|uniref:DUF1289 domain-containing protein n=1 Tax=OM182 bacterium MED-G24 TaxID=1986255 RepID=A0A2A5WQZ1_9GAMM|nr:MAG: DUF1289 domain-containing protein [OM182 bacterium MED-G24]|tara:strand:- start:391 stop:561 length:171 start_codon:yes stop_codon:yes gene_type:complete
MVCTLNEDDVCVGCYRTLDEIGGWGDADSESRLAILDRADDRYRNARLDTSVGDSD